jgi:hypothetical protein
MERWSDRYQITTVTVISASDRGENCCVDLPFDILRMDVGIISSPGERHDDIRV